jgi:UDP-glucose 4-epimerase
MPNLLKYPSGQIDAVNICGACHDSLDVTVERDETYVDDFRNASVNVIATLAFCDERMTCNVGSGKRPPSKK